MSARKSSARALFGGDLAEGAIVRLVYIDEAGTSDHEPVRVVAAIIIHGDDQYRSLISQLDKLYDKMVPRSLRDGFYFHAKELFSGGKKINRDEWPFRDRLELLKEALAIPLANHIPISVGVMWKGAHEQVLGGNSYKIPFSRNKYEHIIAFIHCIERADYALRTYFPGEIALAIAEDIPSNKEIFVRAAMIFREKPTILNHYHLKQKEIHKHLGMPPQAIDLRVNSIVDAPNFLEKRKAPLLQLADACAFTLRRCLSRQSHGEELLIAMLGDTQARAILDEKLWYEDSSFGVFNVPRTMLVGDDVVLWQPD